MLLPDTDTHFKQGDWDNYQREQYDHAVGLCKSHRTALDCGAHVGIMTHRMAQTFELTHAFEPQWHHYLTQNMQAYSRWRLHTVALGKQEGWCSMHVNATNTGGTRVTEGTTTPVRTIDSYGFRDVDLIKMDLEGSELDALLGAEQTIATFKPVLMIELEKNSLQRPTVEQLLRGWGYTQLYRKNADTVWRYEGLTPGDF